jgi:hypothetical protein
MSFAFCRPGGSRRFDPSGNDRLRPLSRADKSHKIFGKRAAETCQPHNGTKKIISFGASSFETRARARSSSDNGEAITQA